MDLPNGGGGGGGDFSSDGNGSVTGREQQELWRNANAFNRYESTLGEYRTEVSFKLWTRDIERVASLVSMRLNPVNE